jgi:hypothetical protein
MQKSALFDSFALCLIFIMWKIMIIRFAAYPEGVHFKVFMCTDLKKIALVVQNAGHGMNINVITLLLE